MVIHGGVNNVSQSMGPHAGVGNVDRQIVRGYIGDAYGVARLIYSSGILPPAYQQVEYIEGTGTQCIDTGEKLTVNSFAMEGTFALTTNVYSGNTYLFGLFNSVRLFAMIYGQSESQKSQICLAIGGGWHRESSANFYTLKKTYKVDMKNLKTYIDGISKSVTQGSYSRGTAATTKFFIFTNGNSNGHNSSCIKGKCYGAKIWKDDELIHDYYPCYQKADDEPGFYDIITDTFLTNAGSGTFGVGPKHVEEL